jgi:hypothetical protein
MNEIDDRLRELRRELRDLSWRRRTRVLEEARDHLLCAVDAGRTPAEAVAQLGDPGEAFHGFPRARRTHRAVTLAVPAALLALAPSVGGLERIGAAVSQSHAATPTPAQLLAQQRAATRQCAAAWNHAPRRFRGPVAAAGAERAHVSITYITKLGAPPSSGTMACSISFQPAPVATPAQPVLRAFARRHGSSFTFDAFTRGHLRSAAPAANARVGSDGRIALSATPVPRICPAGPIGSAVSRVIAGSRDTLKRSGATDLSAARTRTFAVRVTNDGHVSIRGAIVNLSFAEPAAPGRMTWRSLPITIAKLSPGGTVTVRFTAPQSSPGALLVRATTAAVACESRVADNSRVYRVHVR